MHIVYLANIRFPSERANAAQSVAMCQAFAQAGNQVDLYVSSRPSGHTQSPEEYYNLPLAFSYKYIWTPNIVAWGPIFFLLTNIIFAFGALWKLRNGKQDLLYCRDEWVVWTLSFFLSSEKLAYESHEAKYNLPVRSLLKRGVRCVCISQGIEVAYVEKGVSAQQLLVAHDAVDERFLQPVQEQSVVRSELGIVSKLPVVMYIGGLDVWKGVDTLCAASTDQSDFVTYVIGGTSEKIAEYTNRYAQVHFLGQRPYAELPKLQQAADVLVIPNTAKAAISALYTSPLKAFAHATSGIPIVVSDLPSLRNIFSDKEVTFAVADDPLSWQETLASVTQLYEQKQQMASTLKVKAQNYTWKKRAIAIVAFVTKEYGGVNEQ